MCVGGGGEGGGVDSILAPKRFFVIAYLLLFQLQFVALTSIHITTFIPFKDLRKVKDKKKLCITVYVLPTVF